MTSPEVQFVLLSMTVEAGTSLLVQVLVVMAVYTLLRNIPDQKMLD
jgi:hypothetical protein